MFTAAFSGSVRCPVIDLKDTLLAGEMLGI